MSRDKAAVHLFTAEISETLLEFYRAVYWERRFYFSRMNANLISFVDMIERFMLR